MRLLIPLTAAVFLWLPSPAISQDPVRPLVERLNSVDPTKVTAADCNAQVSRAASLSAMDLFYGSAICLAAKKPVEGNFLLTVGQVRAMPDMALMEPASEDEKLKAAGLYGLIWFYAGGPGEEEVYRHPEMRGGFFQMFDAWTAAYGPDYNPGWTVEKRPGSSEYQTAVAGSKTHRRKQLSAISKAYSDDQYYTLHQQFAELQKRTGGKYVEGTQDAKLSAELQAKMDKRAKELSIDFTGQ